LIPILEAAKKAKKTAFLNVDKLHLIEKDPSSSKEIRNIISVDSLQKLPPDLDSRYITTKSNQNCFAFFGQLCPLSNFHKVPVKYKHTRFHCSEQVFQYRKAELAGDEVACNNILSAQSALEAKTAGDKVVDPPNWGNVCQKTMKDTLRLKMAQNPQIKQFLLSIKQETIAEASPHDKFWGTGIGLNKPEVVQPDQWRGGKNILGKLLMELRTEFS
jgi:ribA/ribD-fused uncharacterized protein